MLDSETVETASSTPDHSARNNLAARIGWAILILATLYICYFSHLGAIGFVGPDEPRYAWIARDMVETGEFIVHVDTAMADLRELAGRLGEAVEINRGSRIRTGR